MPFYSEPERMLLRVPVPVPVALVWVSAVTVRVRGARSTQQQQRRRLADTVEWDVGNGDVLYKIDDEFRVNTVTEGLLL